MITINPDMFMTVKEHTKNIQPLPLENGFSEDYAYRIMGIFSPSETSEAYFIMINDREETWFISNRHFKFYRLIPNSLETKIKI